MPCDHQLSPARTSGNSRLPIAAAARGEGVAWFDGPAPIDAGGVDVRGLVKGVKGREGRSLCVVGAEVDVRAGVEDDLANDDMVVLGWYEAG